MITNAVMVIGRVLVPIVGVLMLGWSAPKLLIIYFADTAAAYYAFLSVVAVSRSSGDGNIEPASDPYLKLLRAIIVPLPTLLLIGFFFGILPLFVMLDMQDVIWSDVLRDTYLWWGVLLQFALALGLILQRTFRMRAERFDPSANRVHGILITARWLVMVFIAFFVTPGIPRVVYGPLLIAVYAILTALIDLAPQLLMSWAMRIVGRSQVPR